MVEKSSFAAVYAAAVAAGAAAGAGAKPAAIVVGEAVSLMSSEIDYSKPVYYESEGVCGFAWVSVKPGNSAFAKWLLAEGLARKDSYEGGVRISIREYGQSLERKDAHAMAMAKSLREAGIERAYAGSRMD